MAISYGLLGERLAHSFSPHIHQLLGGYDYQLIELPRCELDDFLRRRCFRGLNVTIPYKKAVIPYCDKLSPQAQRIGSVNTLVIDDNGLMTGYNTDYDGLMLMARSAAIDMRNAKALILGSGGASLTAAAVASDFGAKEIITVSRRGPVDYTNVYCLHSDAEIIINATPCGMYPDNGGVAIDLAAFPACRGVLELVYNPLRTNLLLAAQQRKIAVCGGLVMLVEQARRSAELFLDKKIAAERTEAIIQRLSQQLENIVLIGMPGCGKSSIGQRLAQLLDREFLDMDQYIARSSGSTPEEIIVSRGEAAFREIESAAAQEIAQRQGLVIATGGGTVLNDANMLALRQNGQIFFIERELTELATSGRPLSANVQAIEQLYQQRLPLYRRYAAATVVNDRTIDEAVHTILALWRQS